jgi:protein SCO1
MASWFSITAISSVAAILSACAVHALPSYSTVPDFTLTDQSGAQFASASALKNTVWIADFIFTTCPGPCPRMSSQMHEIENALAQEPVKLVSFTVDPDRDTPPVLAEYAGHFGAKPGVWFFLTGDKSTLQHLDRDVFFLGNIDGTLEHSTRFLLIDRSGRVRGYYDSISQNGEESAIPRLIADAKALTRARN